MRSKFSFFVKGGGRELGLIVDCWWLCSPFTSEIYAKRERERRQGKKTE